MRGSSLVLAVALVGCGSSSNESPSDAGAGGAGGNNAGAGGSVGGVGGVQSVGGSAGAVASGGNGGTGGIRNPGSYTRVFHDGFENGIDAWDQVDARDKCTPVTTSLDGQAGAHAGSTMLRCNWNGVVTWDDPASVECVKLSDWDYGSETLFRFWFRGDADTDSTIGAKYYRWGGNGSFGGVGFDPSAPAQTVGFFGTDDHQIGTTFWGEGSVLGDRSWHRVDVYVKYGETDGVARLWEDGVQLWEAVDVDTRQSPAGITPFYLMSNWSSNPGWEHDADNHVYWDEFEVFSDSATGEPTTGELADASVQP